MVREAASVAPVAPPPMAPTMAIVAMVVPIVVANAPWGPLAVEVHQRIVIAQFLQLKPSTFVEDGTTEMAE